MTDDPYRIQELTRNVYEFTLERDARMRARDQALATAAALPDGDANSITLRRLARTLTDEACHWNDKLDAAKRELAEFPIA